MSQTPIPEDLSGQRRFRVTGTSFLYRAEVDHAAGAVGDVGEVIQRRRRVETVGSSVEKNRGVVRYLVEQEGSHLTPFETAKQCLATYKKMRA